MSAFAVISAPRPSSSIPVEKSMTVPPPRSSEPRLMVRVSRPSRRPSMVAPASCWVLPTGAGMSTEPLPAVTTEVHRARAKVLECRGDGRRDRKSKPCRRPQQVDVFCEQRRVDVVGRDLARDLTRMEIEVQIVRRQRTEIVGDGIAHPTPGAGPQRGFRVRRLRIGETELERGDAEMIERRRASNSACPSTITRTPLRIFSGRIWAPRTDGWRSRISMVPAILVFGSGASMVPDTVPAAVVSPEGRNFEVPPL